MAIRIMQNVIFITSSNSQSPSLHSSSNAFSPTSSSSDPDNPSTSDCSNAQSGKVRTQKELMKAVNELKMHLPIERIRGKSNTLSTLKYALRCVKQVRANEEYYKLLMKDDSPPSRLNMSMNSYTVEEMESITSEYTLINADIFAVAISLITGRIVYISDQAASVLNCKKNVFKNAKFIEFLAPQDAGVFYTFTSPSQLPLWSVCTAAGSPPPDCVLEKSFFCRMSGGWERDGSIQYYPFRMTPYLTNVQRSEDVEDELCCLLIAERVHSGYEAPRIPLDKRIFTTTHTPSCIFQDIDERAVPLLGYLPQDLIGTAVLMHLHPGDRSLMLGIHKKILKHAGQPFDHSPLRFCTHNGEYITIDTSWSSFVNPWSRKVSFIIGRHKVRTGPLNEDIFATPSPGLTEVKMTDSEIQTITEQIHKLLLQPVYKKGSSGYGSLGSNGSYGQFMSIASSSDSNGNEECSRVSPVSCLSSDLVACANKVIFKSFPCCNQVIKRLNSELRKLYRISKVWIYCDCIVYHSVNHDLFCIYRYLDSCNVPSNVKSKSEPSSNSEDKQKRIPDESMQVSEELLSHQTVQTPLNPTKEIPAPLTHLPLPRKAESIVSFTSQCSYRSTIVHVGDKKPQADPEILDAVDSSLTVSVNQEKEQYKKRGLTKEVLAAHTQNEEQVFLRKFKELSKLKAFESPCKSYLQERHKGVSNPAFPGCFAEPLYKRGGKNKKLKLKRMKQQESSESTFSGTNQHRRIPSWLPTDISQPRYSALLPTYPLPLFPTHGSMPSVTDSSLHSFVENAQDVHRTMQPTPFSAPFVAPMVAYVLPNYMFPQMNYSVHQPFFAGNSAFPSQPAFPPRTVFSPPSSFQCPPQFTARPDPPADTQKTPAPSCCSTPLSVEPQVQGSPPLFQSRCSSPLQLNLLQLEETPMVLEQPETTAFVEENRLCGRVATTNITNTDIIVGFADLPENSDTHSTSTNLLALLLEDSHSCTGSADSVSVGSTSSGSPSNRCGMSGTDTVGSSQLSNTSNYFGSIDSSENDHKSKVRTNSAKNKQFMKCVLQGPFWLTMSNTDEEVMMSYQLPSRDMESILKEDREKLKMMQKNQPRFTEQQKKEISEVHPWIKTGELPKAINLAAPFCCGRNVSGNNSNPLESEVGSVELSEVVESNRGDCHQRLIFSAKEQKPTEMMN
uniref:Period circadian protein homolog 2 n=1 Tax=Callorhinchus milii TaxID=7868 RepID=A0A4W3J919_CALMI